VARPPTGDGLVRSKQNNVRTHHRPFSQQRRTWPGFPLMIPVENRSAVFSFSADNKLQKFAFNAESSCAWMIAPQSQGLSPHYTKQNIFRASPEQASVCLGMTIRVCLFTGALLLMYMGNDGQPSARGWECGGCQGSIPILGTGHRLDTLRRQFRGDSLLAGMPKKPGQRFGITQRFDAFGFRANQGRLGGIFTRFFAGLE